MILAHRLIPAEPARNYFASVINGIDYADEFTKTVFVQLQPNEGLKQLRTNFRPASLYPYEYQLTPHLSLIYKPCFAQQKGRSLTR